MSTVLQPSEQEQFRARDVTAELRRRRNEALRLYRPRPEQMPFHLSRATEKLARGGVRSGKTTCWAAEIASAATGIPLIGTDDTEIPFQYPRRALLIWLIGFSEGHIGVIHRKLFQPGLFRIIKDRQSGQWRTWRPWEPDDAAREDKTKESPPLIPPRWITNRTWEKQGPKVFIRFELINGTEIYAYTSGTDPSTGESVDIVAIDEDIKYPSHMDEWRSRIIDRKGRILWASWPRTANRALQDMSRRAAEQASREEPDVFEIVLRMRDNPYLDKKEKQKAREAWGGVVSRARDLGEFVEDLVLVFPEFSVNVQGSSGTGCPAVLRKALEDCNYKPPWNWTHYLILDPGHTQPALLFAAVPPPELGDHIVLYDEIYTPNIAAQLLANEVASKAAETPWEAFIIDAHAGRVRGMTGGASVKEQWTAHFRSKGLSSRQTGNSFADGCDDIGARNMLSRDWMQVRQDGTTKLIVVESRTQNFQQEMVLYKKRVSRDDISDKIVDKDNHLCDALGYLAAFDPQYVAPDSSNQPLSPAYRAHLDWDAKQKPQDQSIYMGPGAAPNAQPAPDYHFV